MRCLRNEGNQSEKQEQCESLVHRYFLSYNRGTWVENDETGPNLRMPVFSSNVIDE